MFKMHEEEIYTDEDLEHIKFMIRKHHKFAESNGFKVTVKIFFSKEKEVRNGLSSMRNKDFKLG